MNIDHGHFGRAVTEAALHQARANGHDPDAYDTPRRRGTAAARALKADIPIDQALQEAYDPDASTRAFYKPMADYGGLYWVPVKLNGEWCDPPEPHRIQVVEKEKRRGKWVTKLVEHRVRTAAELRDLAATPEYRRAKVYETTGEWHRNAITESEYRRVFDPDVIDPYACGEGTGRYVFREGRRTLKAKAKAFRESSFDFGDSGGGTSGPGHYGPGVTADMDDEFIPIMGGPFCFTGDTRVALLDGTHRTMEELARDFHGRDFWVYSATPNGEIVPGHARGPQRTGVQVSLVAVTLDNGESVRCTPDHQWMLRDGTYRRARELQPGDSLMPLYTKESSAGLPGYTLLYQPSLNRYTYAHKSFTGRVPKGYVVHHKNFNKKDNCPDNLKVMLRADHQRLHMTAATWWSDPDKRARASEKIRAAATGRQYSAETIANMSAAVRKRYAEGWIQPNTGRRGWLTEEHKAAVRNSPLRRERIRQSNLAREWTPEMRQRTAESVRAYYADNPISEKARDALDAGRARKQEILKERRAAKANQKWAWTDERRRQRAEAMQRKMATDPGYAERIRETMETGRLKRAANLNHRVVSVTPAGIADVYDFSVERWGNFALSAGAIVHNSRQLYLHAHWEMTARAFYEKNHSELAKSAIAISTDFVIGAGISWRIKNPLCKAIWQEFWNRNDMDTKLRDFSDSATWQGEVLIRKWEALKGFLRVQEIDPSTVLEIITEIDDVSAVLLYHQSFPAAYQLPYADYRGHHLNVPLSKYIIRQLPANEVLHVKLNVASNEKWGRSDFYPSFSTLKRHRDWCNAAVLKDLEQANLIWDMAIQGDDSDVNDFIQNPDNAQLPAYGGTYVHNTAVTLAPMHADVASTQRTGQGNTGSFLASLFATNMQMPSQYFNIAAAGAARATALTQSEPWVKRVIRRQTLMQNILDHLYEETLKCAVKYSRLSREELSHGADPEWFFPPVYEEDRGALFRDYGDMFERKAVSHRTMSTAMARQLHLDEYDYDAEMRELAKEAASPVLGPLLNPPAPPMMPGINGQPAPDAHGNALSPSENIAGADATARFKQQQQDRPGPALPDVTGQVR